MKATLPAPTIPGKVSSQGRPLNGARNAGMTARSPTIAEMRAREVGQGATNLQPLSPLLLATGRHSIVTPHDSQPKDVARRSRLPFTGQSYRTGIQGSTTWHMDLAHVQGYLRRSGLQRGALTSGICLYVRPPLAASLGARLRSRGAPDMGRPGTM